MTQLVQALVLGLPLMRLSGLAAGIRLAMFDKKVVILETNPVDLIVSTACLHILMASSRSAMFPVRL